MSDISVSASAWDVCVVIPSRHTQTEQSVHVQDILQLIPSSWCVRLSNSIENSRDQMPSHRDPEAGRAQRVTAVAARLGYASARNAAILEPHPTVGYLFIDDDVHVTPDAIAAIDRSLHNTKRLVGVPVSRRPARRSRFLEASLGAQSTTGFVDSLSGGFLYVPTCAVQVAGQFPTALDFVGAEDTAFTRRCGELGFQLVRTRDLGCYEDMSECDANAIIGIHRMISNRSALRLLSRVGDPDRWQLVRIAGLGLMVCAIAQMLAVVAMAYPTLAVLAAKRTGALCGSSRILIGLPLRRRSGSVWLVRISKES